MLTVGKREAYRTDEVLPIAGSHVGFIVADSTSLYSSDTEPCQGFNGRGFDPVTGV